MANSYLNRTPSGAGNRKTFTISAWIKRSSFEKYGRIIASYVDDNNRDESFFHETSQKFYFESVSSSTQVVNMVTTRVFRDTNAWYHLVVAVDTTQGTASNRVKIYVNGVQETAFDTETYPSQNYDFNLNNNIIHYIGRSGYQSGTNSYFNGYMSHVAFVDGQALAPTVFGQTDSTSGIWKFKPPSGVTWGTNGFHLKMENSGALGTDSSGNTNTFTVNGNLKQTIDTPSNVYPTLNVPAQTESNTLIVNGNLTFHMTADAGQRMYISTLGVDTGKWYFEAKLVAKGNTGGSVPYIGAYAYDNYTNTYVGSGNGVGYNINGNVYLLSNDLGASGTTYDNGDIIGCALDVTNSKIYFHKNGTYINSGNPSSGSNGYDISTLTAKGTLGFAVSLYDNNGNWDLNYGAGLFGKTVITSAGSNGNGSLFEYDVPTGFYALNTKNLNTYG